MSTAPSRPVPDTGWAPHQLLPGDPRHGVVAYGRALAEAAGCPLSDTAMLRPGEPIHLHFTERLWGPTPAEAAAALTALSRRHPLTVTLHDLPQASDGAESFVRRASTYAEVVAAATGVVCNSAWERRLLTAAVGSVEAPVAVIPLAVPERRGASARSEPEPSQASGARPTLAILGWFYPGKGHAQAVAVAAALREQTGMEIDVVGLGAVSPGHEAEAAALERDAQERGVAFRLSGFLSDADLVAAAQHATVPLAAHEHISASASIGFWLGAGRRPLVVDSAYAEEIAALRPGTIRRYRPETLTEVVLDALTHPERTRLAPDADLRPGFRETARAYLDWWTHEVAW